VLCLSLVSSFFRLAFEVWSLAVLTHEQGNWCFLTTIADMIWDMLPVPKELTCQPTQPQPAIQCPAQAAAAPEAAVTDAPAAVTEVRSTMHTAPEDAAAVTDAPVQMSIEQHSTPSNAGVVLSGKPPAPAPSPRKGHMWVVLWTWVLLLFSGTVTVLLCISIGCVGLLVLDGIIQLYVITLPRYRFAGDARCGAGSVFGALHSGSSCTLPNLVAV
jgi:hypothetical protein